MLRIGELGRADERIMEFWFEFVFMILILIKLVIKLVVVSESWGDIEMTEIKTVFESPNYTRSSYANYPKLNEIEVVGDVGSGHTN